MGFDPIDLAWVLLGSLIVATLQCGWAASGTAMYQAGRMLHAKPDQDARDADALALVAHRLAARSGIWSIDQLTPAHPDMAALLNCANRHIGSPDYAARIAACAARKSAERNYAVQWWLAAAEAAPAMGMIGTIFGMIQLFGQQGDMGAMGAMGAGLGLALHTTLYGLILASLIAGPIAQRLAHLAQQADGWQRQLADALAQLPVKTAPAP
jgi:chemotaxis protein MotA